jgi:L-threonylcarbamoyladenylate synthase
VVLYPSDTVYGLLCDAQSTRAVAGLARSKGYSTPRPFIVIVRGVREARELAVIPKRAERLVRDHWPGPLSLVLPALSRTPANLQSDRGEIAVRVPADPLSQALLRLTRRPLATTSANRAGESHPHSVAQVPEGIISDCALVLDSGELPPKRPSTVVRAGEGGMEVLRLGAVDPGVE